MVRASLELRDGDADWWQGVQDAITNLTGPIAARLTGMNACAQAEIDEALRS